MQKVWLAVTLGAVVLAGRLWWSDRAESVSAEETVEQKASLKDLFAGRMKIVDLTWALNEENAYWPGEGYHPFELKTIATLEEDGVLSKVMCLPEHLGTHLDAPNHFEANQPALEEIPAKELFTPGVVIDVSIQSEQDADYRLTREDVQAWEKKHGRIPERAVVMLYTGWSRFWNNYERYKNQDVRGRLHFPGYSEEAARFLVEERKIQGVGIDTLSIDRGISENFGVHHVINGASKFGLENVARLDQLPARDFYLVIAPMKIEEGTGGPTRIFAVVPGEEDN